MKNDSTIALYKKHYRDIYFERSGLFKFICENYACGEVLYPGCFAHITPSFYFPHVIYVDQDPVAVNFFADQAGVQQFVNRNKKYKRSAFIQFVACDYLQEMPFADEQFDILLALYASGIALACKRYLKIGGILVTNNFQKEAEKAALDDEYLLVSVVHHSQNEYRPIGGDSTRLSDSMKKASVTKYLRQTSQGVEYTEPDDYFFFQKRKIKDRKVVFRTN